MQQPLALTGDLLANSQRPVLSYCVPGTGERTDLTAPALGSLVAQTATMLRDGYGLTSGDHAAVLLPAHWQTAAVLLGAWSIGLTVSVRPWASAGLGAGAGDPGRPLQAVFVSLRRLNSWLEEVPDAQHRFVLGLGPGAALLDDVPTGYHDYLSEVRRYSDDAPTFPPTWHAEPATPDGTSFQEWMDVARGIAESLNLRAGDRLLVNADTTEQPVKWLLAPLSAGASIVLCSGLSGDALAEQAAAEGATHVL